MRKFFAVVFLLIFWVSLSLGMLFLNVRYTVFSPDYVKNVLTKSDFYSQISDLVVEDYIDEKYMDQDTARQAFSPTWVEGLFITIIDAVYDQFLFDADFTDLAEVYVDVSTPKQIVVTMFTEMFATGYSTDLTANFDSQELNQALDDNVPNEVNLLSFIAFISQPPSIQLSLDPQEQFSFLKALGEKGDANDEMFASFKENLELMKNLRVIIVFCMYVCIASALFSVLILALLFVKRRGSMLTWLATSTLPPGIATFGLAGLAKIYFMFNQNYIANHSEEVFVQMPTNPKMMQLYTDILYAFLHPILNRFIIFGLIFLILGILFLVLKKVIHKPAQ